MPLRMRNAGRGWQRPAAAHNAHAFAAGTSAIKRVCSQVGMGSNNNSAQKPAINSKTSTPSGNATPNSQSSSVTPRRNHTRQAGRADAASGADASWREAANAPSASANLANSVCTRATCTSVSPAAAARVSTSARQSPNTSSGSAPAAKSTARCSSQCRSKTRCASGFHWIMGGFLSVPPDADGA